MRSGTSLRRSHAQLETGVGSGEGSRWHLPALPVLVKRVLSYLGLSDEVYTRLVINSG